MTRDTVVAVLSAAKAHGMAVGGFGDDDLIALTCRTCGATTGRDTVAAQYARAPHGCPACSVAEAAA